MSTLYNTKELSSRQTNQQFMFPKSEAEKNSIFNFSMVNTAQIYYGFLHLVSSPAFHDKKFLERAVYRYKMFLGLGDLVAEKGLDYHQLVPTRDISLVMAVHKLHPVDYQREIPGKGLFQNWYYHQNLRLAEKHVSEKNVEIPHNRNLQKWRSRYERTEELWQEVYGEEYHKGESYVDMIYEFFENDHSQFVPEKYKDIELYDAVLRHQNFCQRVLRMGDIDPALFKTWAEDYERFFMLNKTNSCLVPTLTIDIVWHAHMLSTVDYMSDCQNHLNRIVNHDDTIDDVLLDANFEKTKKLYLEKYGKEYLRVKKQKKSKKDDNNYAGCGGCVSCGYGSRDYHAQKDLEYRLDDTIFDVEKGTEVEASASDSGWSSCSSCSSCGGCS